MDKLLYLSGILDIWDAVSLLFPKTFAYVCVCIYAWPISQEHTCSANTRVNISWFKNFLGAFYKYIKINICILGLLKNLICNQFLFSSITYMVVIDIIIFEEE